MLVSNFHDGILDFCLDEEVEVVMVVDLNYYSHSFFQIIHLDQNIYLVVQVVSCDYLHILLNCLLMRMKKNYQWNSWKIFEIF